MQLDEAVRSCMLAAREHPEAPGDAWREATPCLREPLLQLAADAANEVLADAGLTASDGLVSALDRLVQDHLAAIAAYGDLLDGVLWDKGVEGLDGPLSEERVAHVVETEARHLRSGVTVLCVVSPVQDLDALVASGMVFREYVRDHLGRFAPVYNSGEAGSAVAAALDGETVVLNTFTDGSELHEVMGREVTSNSTQMIEHGASQVAQRMSLATDDQMRSFIKEADPELDTSAMETPELRERAASIVSNSWASGGQVGGILRDYHSGNSHPALEHPDWGPVIKDYGDSQRAITQDWLAERNVEAVRLYRGGQGDHDGLRSWSTSELEARPFGDVVVADVPASAIVGLPVTGLGTMMEREIVVLNEGLVMREVPA